MIRSVAIGRVECWKYSDAPKFFLISTDNRGCILQGPLEGIIEHHEMFESSQQVLRIVVYSENLQFGLTLEDSRSVESITAVKSL
jgi:hypothetical protein